MAITTNMDAINLKLILRPSFHLRTTLRLRLELVSLRHVLAPPARQGCSLLLERAEVGSLSFSKIGRYRAANPKMANPKATNMAVITTSVHFGE